MKILQLSIITTILTLFSIFEASAQVPSYAYSSGKGGVYSYLATSFRPGNSSIDTYLTFQYGVLNKLDVGIDLLAYSGGGFDQGFNIKYNFFTSDHFVGAVQTSAYFNLQDNFRYSYQSSCLLFNGTIVKDLGYCANTFMNNCVGGGMDLTQMWYLTYDYKFITAYAGMTHSWIGDLTPDLAVGVSLNSGKFSFYLWGGELTGGTPMATIGVEFILPSPTQH